MRYIKITAPKTQLSGKKKRTTILACSPQLLEQLNITPGMSETLQRRLLTQRIFGTEKEST